MVTVSISMALICFNSFCYPILVGESTPTGEFQLQHRTTSQTGYGGDVLLFKENENGVFAIHRIINFNPAQRRLQRILSPAARDRIITDGCINVMPDVYEKIVECCSNDILTISK